MKTTIDIRDQDLEDALRFTGAKTKREAVVTAIRDFNRRQGMADLVKYSGKAKSLISHGEMKSFEFERLRKLGMRR